jgi:hypothetical protein
MVDWSYAADRRRVLGPCGHFATGEGGVTTYTYTYTAQGPPPAFAFVHDKEKRVFCLTGADGKAEVFRDNPVRYLVVEPDPETGELKPATKCGKPVYLYLCREEREKG